MTRNIRYVLYGIMFLIIGIGLVSHSYWLLGGSVVVSIALGLLIDKYDNLGDEKHKHNNNTDFNYHH